MSVLSMLLDVANTCNEGFWILYLAKQLLERQGEYRSYRRDMLLALLGYVVLIIGFNQIELVSPYTVLAAIVYMLLVISLIWKEDLVVNIAIVTAYYMLFMLSAIIEIGAVGWIGGDTLIAAVTEVQGFPRLIFILICGIIWFLLNWGISRMLSQKIIQRGKRYIIFICAIGIAGSIFLADMMLDMFGETLNILIFAFLALFITACYGLYFRLKYKELVQKQQLDFAINAIMEEKYQQLAKSYEEKRKSYHDMDAHFRAILEIAEREHAEHVVQYIQERQQMLKLTSIKRWTGTDIVDSILTEQISAAQEKGIQVLTDIQILPLDSYIKNVELCSIFSNLLKNCMEANPTKIDITIKQAGEMLIIRTANDYKEAPKKENGRYKTSKKVPEAHGLGLRIIEDIAERYRGTVTYNDEGAMFSVNILMNLTEIR